MVFSDLDTAIELAPEIVEQEEHDLYLCETRYPSGVEYSLRREIPYGFTCVDCFKISFKHHFKSEKSARLVADVFEHREEVKIQVRPKYEIIKGYQTLLYFYLIKTDIPCSI